MSQEKVDKRKYEKYHRKEIQRKQKRKAMIATVVFVLVLGTAIGIPLGYKIYDMIPKKVSANEVIYKAWVSNYVQQMDGYPFIPDTTEDNTEDGTEKGDSTGEASDNSSAEDGTTGEASDNAAAEDGTTKEASEGSTAEGSSTEEAADGADTEAN